MWVFIGFRFEGLKLESVGIGWMCAACCGIFTPYGRKEKDMGGTGWGLDWTGLDSRETVAKCENDRPPSNTS